MSGLPSGQEKRHDDTNHDGCFHELSQSRAEMWDDPQYTNRAEDETGSEYEHEIEYTGFQDLHDGLQPSNRSGLRSSNMTLFALAIDIFPVSYFDDPNC